MSLPRIDAYPLPGAGDIPRGRVAWQPEPDRAALLVHDMQRYFLAPFEPAALRGLLGNIASVLRECRARSIPVFYTAQPGRQSARERGLLTEFWG
jgi:bifunctional isochorismate lyase/aryl carrier protein